MFGRRFFLRGAGAAVAAAPVVARNALQRTVDLGGSGYGVSPAVGGGSIKAPDALKALWDQQNDMYSRHHRQRKLQQRTILAMRSWSPAFAELEFAKLEDEQNTTSRRMSDAIEAMREKLKWMP